MPVVEKFMAIPSETFNYNGPAMTQLRQCKEAIRGLSIATPIDTVYNTLLAGIMWYNSEEKGESKLLETIWSFLI